MLTRLRNSTQELPCLKLHTSSALLLRAWSVRSTSDDARRLTHSWRMRFPVSARRSAVLHFKDHANDITVRNHAYKAGTAVYRSLGATQVFELPPFPSTHN